jgi:hypothetical protein
MNYPGTAVKQNHTDICVVKCIQQQLNRKGCGPLKIDGDYSRETMHAVMLFQARFTDLKGNPLKVDGIIGPITWTALFGAYSNTSITSAPNVLLASVLDIARTQLGVIEEYAGSNNSRNINYYQDAVGIKHGEPWSMAFIYWCFRQTCISLEVPNPVYRTGDVLDEWCKARAKKITAAVAKKSTAMVLPGQVFIMSTGGGYGHTGFVEKVEGGMLTTIEGNTNTYGCIEGSGVFRRTGRLIDSINVGFIQFE